MSNCKDCTCEMKYININMKNKKNLLCKKNNSNIKFIIPFEFMFYLSSFSLFTYYNYRKNNNLVLVNNLN